MGGEFGGEWTHVYVWLSPFAVHLKRPQHCSPAMLQYKIKSFFKSLQIANVDKDVENTSPSAISGNVNWCSHYGKQSGGSSKTYKYNYHMIQQFHFGVYI